MRLLLNVLGGLRNSIVDTAVNEWRKHLQARVRANRRYFEHLLYRQLGPTQVKETNNSS